MRQHRALKHEPLRLAVYFAPPRRGKGDIFLFEVIDGFGADGVDPDHKLFEFGYGSTPAFPMRDDLTLRMILTNPTELRVAIRDHWKGIEKLRAARDAGRSTVIYADAIGRAALGCHRMTLPQAWMRQAESDYRAALRVDNPSDPRTRCQAISKYQQCVEKAVKAVLDKLFMAGLIRNGSDRSHKVARYVSVLTRFPTTRDNKDLVKQMQRMFTATVVEQIKVLDSLVPEYPADGSMASRNHEYPFQDATGDWHAPCDHDAFTAGEIRRI